MDVLYRQESKEASEGSADLTCVLKRNKKLWLDF